MLCSERRESKALAAALLEPARSIGCYRLAFEGQGSLAPGQRTLAIVTVTAGRINEMGRGPRARA